MITAKELEYVHGWANKVPYPGEVYAYETMDKLAQPFDEFDKYYSNKEYDIILSNGEQISFEILDKNVCHMLGIDHKNLTSPYFDNFRQDVLGISPTTYLKSYDLLSSIIEHSDKVVEYDSRCGGKVLNYYKLSVKSSIFDRLSAFGRFNFGVINFDKELYNASGSTFNGNSKKFFYIQSNETTAPYFLVGILPNKYNNQNGELVIEESKYAVETLFAPEKPESFFKDQEVVIPTQILAVTQDTMDKRVATASDKIALLNQYRSIILENNLPNKINIYGDYETILCEQESQTRKREL